MPYELIITEKPQAAKKIADALADGRVQKGSDAKVPHYRFRRGDRDIVVGCALGHLYSVVEKVKGKWTYPVFDVKWAPIKQAGRGGQTARFLSTLRALSRDASAFTVACDYDVEGEVIGLNVVRHACKQKDARRMKFSTLTKQDLVRAYDTASPSLDWGQANAGLTRHELDWYYGINLSRALTLAVKSAGMFKILSSGRVQGPALKIIVEREKEIAAFKSEPFWQLELQGELKGKPIVAWHASDKFWERGPAEAILEKTRGKDGRLTQVDKKQVEHQAPVPFDLTTLQTEAYKSLRLQPKKTLEVAQALYVAGLISYPRTSSQKLPPEIGYRQILEDLARQEYYRGLAHQLLGRQGLSPREGKKTDPAHPAIYPTGQISPISGERARLYDLIVRRFLATFGEPAIRETVTLTIEVEEEPFVAKGTRTVTRGWHVFYEPHLQLDEQEMPESIEGDDVKVREIILHDKQTQPPKRYTPASIIRELERRNLGTKATRAAIIDSLFDRGYVHETSIEATALGIRACDTLAKYSPEILDEELTRYFEEKMEKIRENQVEPEQVLAEAREKLRHILENFRKQEKAIGQELAEALSQTRDELNFVGMCPLCKEGRLEIRKGRFGRFIACDKYPDCKTTFKLPAGMIKQVKEPCEACGYPMLLIIRGKRGQKVCINGLCPRKENHDPELRRETEELKNGTVEKECPKCKKPLVVRKSIYGQFLGCSGFPKCRYTEKIGNGPVREDFRKAGQAQ